MRTWKRYALIVIVITGLLLTSTGFQATAADGVPFEKGSPEAMAGDLVFVRPVGFVTTVVGSVFFVASLPFSLPGGNGKAAFRGLVANPAGYTFDRPLGEFEK